MTKTKVPRHVWTTSQTNYLLSNHRRSKEEIAAVLGIKASKVEAKLQNLMREGRIPTRKRTSPLEEGAIKINEIKVNFKPGKAYYISYKNGEEKNNKKIIKTGVALADTGSSILFQFPNYKESFLKVDIVRGKCNMKEAI